MPFGEKVKVKTFTFKAKALPKQFYSTSCLAPSESELLLGVGLHYLFKMNTEDAEMSQLNSLDKLILHSQVYQRYHLIDSFVLLV